MSSWACRAKRCRNGNALSLHLTLTTLLLWRSFMASRLMRLLYVEDEMRDDVAFEAADRAANRQCKGIPPQIVRGRCCLVRKFCFA